jgi:hypothetical protein
MSPRGPRIRVRERVAVDRQDRASGRMPGGQRLHDDPRYRVWHDEHRSGEPGYGPLVWDRPRLPDCPDTATSSSRWQAS